MAKISVIVPVYNVEDYLNECLDSIINQTFEDIEIICVNDGSTDNSLAILEDYEKKDERIKIISQENCGLSCARNKGMSVATGEYIYFIDSDDYLESEALGELYDLAEKKDLDVILFKLINVDDDTKEKYPTKYYDMEFLKEKVGDNVFDYKDLGEDLYRLSVSIPGKLFKSDLISDMRFLVGLIFEDTPFFTEVMFKAKKVYFHNKYLYNRRIRSNSITSSSFSKFSDIVEIMNQLFELSKKYNFYDETKNILFYKKFGLIFTRFKQVNESDKAEFFEKIKKDFTEKQESYESEEAFQNLGIRQKEIFYSGVESQTWQEFELRVDLLIAQDELRIAESSHKREIKQLQIANNNLQKENDELTEELNSLKRRNDEITNSRSWKVTKPLRKTKKVFKK